MTAPFAFPAAPATISGRALHSGARSTVTITVRADDGLGLRFLFPGFAAPLTARDLARLTRRAQRATILTDDRTGAVIRTPEHLLAAALFFARAPLDVACDAEEIPGLDGSARPWFDLLARAAHPAAFIPHPPHEYETDLRWSYEGPEGCITAEPASAFSVRYTVYRDEFRETATLVSAADAPATILPARTFIFHDDWMKLRAASGHADAGNARLLSGADEDSGLLLASSQAEFARALPDFPGHAGNAFPLLHPRAFRVNHEAARHKVLDLLGDLALGGLALPKLRLTIENGGHALHHLLLDALLARGVPHAATPQGDAS